MAKARWTGPRPWISAASELVERAREESRLFAIAGKDSITVSWGDWALENVPLGQFADRVSGWIKEPGRTASEVARWAEANRDPLRLFWAKSPSDALELKRTIEECSVGSAEPGVATNEGAPAKATAEAPERTGSGRTLPDGGAFVAGCGEPVSSADQPRYADAAVPPAEV